MTKQDVINELEKRDIKNYQVRYSPQSRYWKGAKEMSEAWVYTPYNARSGMHGYCVTQEDFETDKELWNDLFDMIKAEYQTTIK